MRIGLKAQEPTFFPKPMAPAVPIYAISVFKVPLNLCEDIQKAMRHKFWWDSTKDKHNIHRARWERIGYAKHREGLGFENH